MSSSPKLSRRAVYALGLLLCILVTGASLLFFSPLHQHDPGSSRACIFTQFEHGNGSELPVIATWVAPVLIDWTPVTLDSPRFQVQAPVEPRSGRAPPAA